MQSMQSILSPGRGQRTFGVCDFTLPARAREPWTLPMMTKLLVREVEVLVNSLVGRVMDEAIVNVTIET